MEKQPHQHFSDLDVRKKARELKKESEKPAKTFPSEKIYRPADQVVRSVRSINANIAEGQGRFPFKNQLHFCIQARGSLSETEIHSIDTFDCDYILPEELHYYKTKADEVGRLFNG